jgi:hypothetical protein
LTTYEYRKASKFVYLLLKYGCFPWFCTSVVSVTITGEWSDERLKHDLVAKFWMITFVTQEFNYIL